MPEIIERERRNMAYIPIDLVATIFSRLPVETLLRFRCISKSFCTLIDDPVFIKSHLNQSIRTKNNINLLIKSHGIFSVAFDSLDEAIEIDLPFENSNLDTEFLGCCDGLICLGIGKENAAIFNPATRKYFKLPFAPIEFPENFEGKSEIVHEIGYDSVTDDYKVVRIVNFDGNQYDSEVRVYSLKLNSWRRIETFPHSITISQGTSVLTCGALHWNYDRYDFSLHSCILAFDLAAEECRLVPQPDFNDPYHFFLVGELEGSLCIFCHYYGSSFDIWAMKDYGVKESWSKLFSVAHFLECEDVVPLLCSKSGHELLMVADSEMFVWYNLEQKTTYHLDIDDLPDLTITTVFVESLVPVKAGSEVDGKKQHKQEKTEKNKEAKEQPAGEEQ